MGFAIYAHSVHSFSDYVATTRCFLSNQKFSDHNLYFPLTANYFKVSIEPKKRPKIHPTLQISTKKRRLYLDCILFFSLYNFIILKSSSKGNQSGTL